MTPPPTMPAFLIRAIRSAPLLQLEALAHLLGTEHADIHRFQDRLGAGHELAVGRVFAAAQIDVVFQTDTDIAAGQRRMAT